MMLNKANETIRKANERITQLKIKHKSEIDHLSNNCSYWKERAEIEESEKDLIFTDLELLAVHDNTNKKLIKENAKRLANIYHPDKTGSTIVMQHINASRDRLLKND